MLRFCLAMLLAAGPAFAQSPPRKLGDFQAWTAAQLGEGSGRVCYAFARPARSDGVTGRRADQVMLIVTHRREGRDQVALRAGYTYARRDDRADAVKVEVGATGLGFFTQGDAAFARDGGAAVAAFKGGREAVAEGPGPNGRGTATDRFPLAGFSAAHEAISRACPPR